MWSEREREPQQPTSRRGEQMPLLNTIHIMHSLSQHLVSVSGDNSRATPRPLVQRSIPAAAASPLALCAACSIRPLARPALQGHRVWHQTNANYARIHTIEVITCGPPRYIRFGRLLMSRTHPIGDRSLYVMSRHEHQGERDTNRQVASH
jgi:hypothetical protein